MKRKYLSAISIILVFMLAFAGCGGGTAPDSSAAEPSSSVADASQDSGQAEAPKEGGYKIGWSTIYLTPSWMQQTNKMMEDRINYWKEKGVVAEYTVANANGDSSQQIAQIDNMISQGYDAIIVIAGSSTALNNIIEKAYDSGTVIINFDSLVTTEKVTSKINTSQLDYGRVCAEWLVKEIGEEGEIIVFNGPAGVSVSDERNQGAKEVLANYPNVKVVTELNSEYNEGPALSAIMPVLDANPNIKGILSLGGSLSSASLKALEEKNMPYIPITGENYNAFLKMWDSKKDEGFTSICVAQPNWLGVLSIDQAIKALDGAEVAAEVIVPIPKITKENLSEFVPNELPDDGYPIADITQAEIDAILGA